MLINIMCYCHMRTKVNNKFCNSSVSARGHSKGHFTAVGHDEERTINDIVSAQIVEETGFKSK